MSQFCPNISHPDWKYSVDKLGKDKTLLLYDAADQRIPTKDEVDNLLELESKNIDRENIIDYFRNKFENEKDNYDVYSKDIIAEIINDISKDGKITTDNFIFPDINAVQEVFDFFEIRENTKIINENGTPIILAHGSPHFFNKFREDKLGTYTGSPSAKQAFFATDDLDTAITYGEYDRVASNELGILEGDNPEPNWDQEELDYIMSLPNDHPKKINWQKEEDEKIKNKKESEGLYFSIEWKDRAIDERVTFENRTNVYPIIFLSNNPKSIDLEGSRKNIKSFNDELIKAKEEGYDALIFKNVSDSIGRKKIIANIYTIFNSNNIRMAVDVLNKHLINKIESSNLSHISNIYNKQQVIDLLMGELSDEQKEIVRPELEQMDKDEFDKEALKAGLNKLGDFYTPERIATSYSKLEESKESFIARMNSRIENDMYKQKDGTLIPITDDSNPEVWWVENTEKLVEFKQNKIFNEYTENEVRSKIKDLRAKYMTEGYIFNSIKSGDKYIIQVVKPIKRESLFTLEDIVNHLDENQDIINRYLDNMVGRSVNSIILSLLEEDISEETRYLLPILQSKLSENPGLNLVISNSVILNEDGKIKAATYEYDSNTITINREAFTGKNANISTLADTVAHEIIHSYTVLAIERSQEPFATEKDKEFYRTMNRLYEIAKRKTKYPKAHAYISLKEFVTGVLTTPKIMEECKEMKISVWRRILNAIGKVLGITSVYQHSLDTIVEFIQTGNEFDFRMTDFQIDIVNRNLDEDRYLQTNNPAHVAYWKILNKYSQDIEFDPVKHEYKHKESGLSLIPTTTSLQKASIIGTYVSSDEETRNKAEAAKNRGKDLGNITHAISEAEIKGIALRLIEQNNFKYTDAVIKKMSDIIKSIYKPGDTMLSEVLVANLNKRIGGHIDLLIIDKNNKIHIYDFKTKEKGFGYYLTENTYGRSLPMSDRDRHACQLSIYSDCLGLMLGEKATSMNIIMIKPTIEEDTIVDVNLDKTHSKNGVLTVDYNYSVYSVYDLLEMESPEEIGKEIFNEDKPDPAEVNATIEEEKKLFENFASQAQVLSEREIIVQQSIKALIHKREIASRKGRTFERVPLEKLIDKLLAEKDVEIQLINIINYANEQSIRIWNQYLDYKNEEKEIPLRVLYSWKDSVSAFNALLDDQDGLNSIITRENGFVGGPDYRNMLESTMKRVSQIKTLYEYVGTEKLVDFLSPYYNKLYAELRLSKTKEYRLRKFLGKIPADVTEKDYVEKAVTEQGEDLKMRTKNLIRVELKKASNDIGLLTRWMDNLLDTTDPVTAAMVKAFVYRDEEARIQSLAKRDEMTLLVRELEQFYSKSGKIPRSMEDFYGFMLERDKDGNLTGHYTHKSLSTLDDDLSKVILASKNLSSYDQRKKLISNWLELNNPLDKAAFKTAYWEYIIELYNTQKLTDKEYRVLEDQTYLTNKLSINEMIEKGLIREDIGSEIRKWFSSNMENYRAPSSKYENPQWKELSKILQNPEDPRTKFYNYVVDLGKEATMFLPESTSLKTRLPGIIKQNYERAAAGQSIGTIIRNGIGKEFTFRTDDTHRHKKILDEEGNEKYFLPIHFTGKLDIEDQSFDLASIYYKYWEMANDYNHKSQILPEMELAKFLIEKRTATKRTFSGKAIINKRKDSKYEDIPEEAIINRTRLAEQVHDWFAACVYGQAEADEGTLLGIDLGKFANFINKYTSMNLLAANFVQGTANVMLGETLQRIEGFAGEYMSNSSWLRADKFYLKNLVGMAGDIGKRSPDNLGTKINEFLGVLDNYGRADLNRRTKFGRMSAMDTLFFTSSLGEHYMQTRFAIGMLSDIKAYDKDGKELGSMLDMYNVNNKGQLVLDDKVDLIKSKWTESDVIDFKIKVRGVLSRLHGEYSELGKVAIQRYALGRMAYMFRKFIIPGFRRRYGRMSYNERLGQFTEGSYVTTFKFLGNAVFKPMFGKEATDPEAAFINRLIEDLGSYKMSIFKARWVMLSDHEKANITRTVSEVGFLIVAIILANIAMSFKGEGDDDAEEQFWAFIAYQAYRFQNELLFFTPKLDSAMSILRSPAASMSVVENLIKLSGQVFHPGDVYERGNWKGKLKITRTLVDMVPVRRQLYRLSNIEDNLTWIQQSAFGGKRDREERKNSSYLP